MTFQIMKSPSRYRYDAVKKHQRRIAAIDITVYWVSGVLAGVGVILSSVTLIAPVAVPISISAITTLAGVATAITKKYHHVHKQNLKGIHPDT